MRVEGLVAACVLVPALLLGCGGGRKLTLEQKMDSAAGVERAQAVMAIGERKDWTAIPYVIGRLEDDDVSVRVLAKETLREMTGRDFGYNAYGPEDERREAVQRWKAWWNSEGRGGPKGK